jgi:hypothetical protein
MRQYREGQTLLPGNILQLRGSGGGTGGGGGGGTGTSGSDYAPTPSEYTSQKAPSSIAGRSTSYSSSSGGVGANNTMSFTAAQQQQEQQQLYRKGHMGFGPTHVVDSKDGGQGQGKGKVQVAETLPMALSPTTTTSQQRARLGRDHSGGLGDMMVPVSITSSNDLQVTHVSVSPEPHGSPRTEEVFMHIDGGRVPDPDAVISTPPQEVPPSYDSIPGNMWKFFGFSLFSLFFVYCSFTSELVMISDCAVVVGWGGGGNDGRQRDLHCPTDIIDPFHANAFDSHNSMLNERSYRTAADFTGSLFLIARWKGERSRRQVGALEAWDGYCMQIVGTALLGSLLLLQQQQLLLLWIMEV